ncbi:anthranilate synthase component I family protein [uncultured Marivirga sp.]|uniref:anthranilate synthase component I family protein n=1 Tax=uncultured Marivirga sp. TaxID=1123707 RepID=UPI0030EC3412
MTSAKIDISSTRNFWNNLLQWSIQFQCAVILYPQQIAQYPFGAFPQRIAVGNKKLKLKAPYFQSLKDYLKIHPKRSIYGYLGYDLKNELEKLESGNYSIIDWEPMGFFEPTCIITIENHELTIESDDLEYYQNEIQRFIKQGKTNLYTKPTIENLKPWTSKSEYINTVNQLRQHIEEGDIYEINYCINFSANVTNFEAIQVFQNLSNNSPAPFASFLKIGNQYIISASPERFIKLKNDKIISQPIKGTAKRGKTKEEDTANKKSLIESEKERAENMMIVDLVRNDLSKSAETATVKVEEMFGIYSFQQVHQMISTISAIKKKEMHSVDIIKNAFPMGSMTGAPKISAMQLIEKYENIKRNVFSGSIGYFKGENEFDFNVLIRSIYYDEQNKKLNYQVGSAITFDSDAEAEYEECLLKAMAIEKTLGLI